MLRADVFGAKWSIMNPSDLFSALATITRASLAGDTGALVQSIAERLGEPELRTLALQARASLATAVQEGIAAYAVRQAALGDSPDATSTRSITVSDLVAIADVPGLWDAIMTADPESEPLDKPRETIADASHRRRQAIPIQRAARIDPRVPLHMRRWHELTQEERVAWTPLTAEERAEIESYRATTRAMDEACARAKAAARDRARAHAEAAR